MPTSGADVHPLHNKIVAERLELNIQLSSTWRQMLVPPQAVVQQTLDEHSELKLTRGRKVLELRPKVSLTPRAGSESCSGSNQHVGPCSRTGSHLVVAYIAIHRGYCQPCANAMPRSRLNVRSASKPSPNPILALNRYPGRRTRAGGVGQGLRAGAPAGRAGPGRRPRRAAHLHWRRPHRRGRLPPARHAASRLRHPRLHAGPRAASHALCLCSEM